MPEGFGSGQVIDNLFVRIGFHVDQAGIRGMNRTIDRVRSSLNKAASAFTRFGLVGAGAIADVMRTSLSFDKALKKLQAVSPDIDTSQLRELSEQAIRVSSKIPLNASDVVEAQTELSKLGLEFEAIRSLTPIVAQASFATDTSLADAARYAAVIRSTFGVAADEVGTKIEAMLMAASRSPTTFQALGESLRFSAKTASQFGLTFESYIATLGLFAESGRSAEEASQGFNQAMGQILTVVNATTTDAKLRGAQILDEALKIVGLRSSHVIGAYRNAREGDQFNAVLSLIQDAAKGDQTKVATVMKILSGSATYGPALSVAAENVSKIREETVALGDAAGEAKRQVDIQMQGLSGAWERVKAGYDTLKTRLGQTGVDSFLFRLLDGTARLLDELTRTDSAGRLVYERFLTMAAGSLVLLSSLLALGAAIRAVSFALGGLKFATAIGGFFLPVRKLSKAGKPVTKDGKSVFLPSKASTLWQRFLKIVRSGQGIIGKLAQGFLRFGKIAGRVFNPLGAIIASFLFGIVTNWDRVVAYLKRGFNLFKPGWIDELFKGNFSGWDFLKDGLLGVIGYIQDELHALKDSFVSIFDWIDEKLHGSKKAEDIALTYSESTEALKVAEAKRKEAMEAVEKAAKEQVASGQERTVLAERHGTFAEALSGLLAIRKAGRDISQDAIDYASERETEVRRSLVVAVETDEGKLAALQSARAALAQIDAEIASHKMAIEDAETRALIGARRAGPLRPHAYEGTAMHPGFDPRFANREPYPVQAAPIVGPNIPAGKGASVRQQNEITLNLEFAPGATPEDFRQEISRVGDELGGRLGRRLVEAFNTEIDV